MGLKSRVQKQVRNAFKAVGDLALDITLLQKNNTEYNFGTETATATTLVTTNTKGIMVKQKRGSSKEQNPSVTRQLLVSAEDVSDPDIYDKVVINGVTWSIVNPYENDGYLINLTITQEA